MISKEDVTAYLVDIVLGNKDLTKTIRTEVKTNKKLRYRVKPGYCLSHDNYVDIIKLPGIGTTHTIRIDQAFHEFISENRYVELNFTDLVYYMNFMDM